MFEILHKFEGYIVTVFVAVVGYIGFRAKQRYVEDKKEKDDMKAEIKNIKETQHKHNKLISIQGEHDKSIQKELTDVKLESREAMKRINLSLDRIFDIITKKEG